MLNIEKLYVLSEIRSLDKGDRVPLKSMSLHAGLYLNIATISSENKHLNRPRPPLSKSMHGFCYIVILSYSTLCNILSCLQSHDVHSKSQNNLYIYSYGQWLQIGLCNGCGRKNSSIGFIIFPNKGVLSTARADYRLLFTKHVAQNQLCVNINITASSSQTLIFK
jgi:hypothetical protein